MMFVPKSNFFDTVLPDYDNEKFWSFTRIDWSSFAYVLSLIQNDKVFQNKSQTSTGKETTLASLVKT